MNNLYTCEKRYLGGMVYRLYKYNNSISSKRLLCIHGAGVAGQLTFEYIIYYLKSYSEILVPDLPGMGDSEESEISRPTISDYLDNINAVVTQEEWGSFDLCGYSLGGLIAAHLKIKLAEYNRVKTTTLIEPALFDDRDMDATKSLRKQYKALAENIFDGQDAHGEIIKFLNLVSPNRPKSPRAEQVAIRRLGSRSIGFAQALNAVANESEILNRERLVEGVQPVVVIAGARSHPPMLEFHQFLQTTQPKWTFVELPGCDHSLPYQKPRRIAELLDQ